MSKTYDYFEGSPRYCMHDTYELKDRCEFCGKPLSENDKEDFGTLCEECYKKEYND